MRTIRSLLIAGVLTVAASADAAAQRLPADSLEAARRYARWFIAGHTDSLVAVIPPAALQALGGREPLANVMLDLAARAGREAAVIEERFVWRQGHRQYWRTVQMTGMEGHLVIRLVIANDGTFGGFGISQAGNTPPTDSVGPPIRRP